MEISFFRFVIGLLALLAAYPRPLQGTDRRQELTFAAAGLCGICLYYLLKNIALTYTMASNVGVIPSVAPFLTAILSRLLLKEEKLQTNFFIGFAVSMAGIILIKFNGSRLELNPAGDLLALLATLAWACYSILPERSAAMATARFSPPTVCSPVYAPYVVFLRFSPGTYAVCKSCVSV